MRVSDFIIKAMELCPREKRDSVILGCEIVRGVIRLHCEEENGKRFHLILPFTFNDTREPTLCIQCNEVNPGLYTEAFCSESCERDYWMGDIEE